MPMQAASTSFSAVLARTTRLALAVTNALASPSIDRLATEVGPPLNSSHPERAADTFDAALSTELAALQPPVDRPAPAAPARTSMGMYFRCFERFMMKVSFGSTRRFSLESASAIAVRSRKTAALRNCAAECPVPKARTVPHLPGSTYQRGSLRAVRLSLNSKSSG